MHQLLIINPGSTTTKVAAYDDEDCRYSQTLAHDSDSLRAYGHVLDQYQFRLDAVLDVVEATGTELGELSATVGRGGLLRPVPSGTFAISHRMLDDLRNRHKVREHASSLGGLLAYEIAERAGVPAFVVDPVSVDEFEDLARVAGLPDIERRSLSHALNLKAVARRVAADLNRGYECLNLVMAHLGGGISVTAHRRGRMVDVNQALDGTGPFAPERAGGLPVGDVVRMCYSVPPFQCRDLSYHQMFKKLAGQGGLVAHLGTNSAIEVEARIAAGDQRARLVYEAMAYQTSKEIAAMASVLSGDVDAIVLTGGVAYSELIVAWIRQRTEWIAPVLVYPGQNEMLAMAQGALRVLTGAESALEY